MRRYLLAGVLVSATAACGPKDEDTNNANNTNNVTTNNGTNNTTNNSVSDMGGDLSDAGFDAERDLTNLYTCRSTTWAPYTIPATEGGVITFDFECDGMSTDTEAEISAEFTYPDGEVVEAAGVLPLNAGATSVDFQVPPHAFIAGPVSVSFKPAGDNGFILSEGTEVSFVNHQTVAEVDANWSEIMAFNPTPPNQNAVIVDTEVTDVDGDGTLDIMVMWRWDKVVGIQTFLGVNRTPGTLKEMPVGVDISAQAPERNDIHVRTGPGGIVRSAYWTGIDPATKTLRIVIGEITDGVLGASKTFDGSTGPFANPEDLLGFEYVDAPGLAADAPAEAFVLYRGKVSGKDVFSTVVTDSLNGKLLQVSALDKIAESVPSSHASGAIQVGLMRDFDASSDAQDAVAQGDVYAWTFGKTGPAGEHQIRTALLSGGEAGLVEKTVLVTGVSATETGFQVETIDVDNDGTNDVILSSVDTDSFMPALRTWAITAPRTFGAQGELATGGFRTLPSRYDNCTKILTVNVCHLRTAGPRFFTSAQYPFLKERAGASGSTGSYFVGTTLDTKLGFGAAISTEFAWAPSASLKNDAVVVAPVTLSGSDSKTINDGASVTLGYARNGINISERELDSQVLIASHESGVMAHFGVSSLSVTLRSSPAVLRVSGPGVAGGEISLAGRGEVVGLLKDADSATHYLFTRNDTKTESGFHVWALTNAGIDGPARINVLPGSKFEPAGATSSNFMFASRCDGNVCGKTDHFRITPAELSNAAKAKSVIELGANEITTLGGIAHQESSVHHRKLARAYRHRNERAQKVRAIRRLNVGVSTIPGLEESMFVSGMDETDGCPFATVFMTGDPATTPRAAVSESTMEGCWDLQTPVASADFCGVDGEQIVTTGVTDASSRTAWQWEALLWMRMGDELMATRFGTFTSKPGEEPSVSVTDVNGDGLVDLIIEQPVGVDGEIVPKTIILGDGMGGNLGPAVIPSLDIMPAMPGAADGLGGGQLACGEGLMCGNSPGTKNSSSSASTKPQLL
jgi:hypothetical protein